MPDARLHVQAMGDKLEARKLAEECSVPTVPGTPEAIADLDAAKAFVASVGLPVILKAAMVRASFMHSCMYACGLCRAQRRCRPGCCQAFAAS